MKVYVVFKFYPAHIIEMIGMGGEVKDAVSFTVLLQLRPGNEFALHPFTLPVETEVIEGMSDVQGARPSIQVEPEPVVHLEGEDVGGAADLQHQVVPAGGMDGAAGDQEKVVFF